jgi:hypothetical protein
MQPDRVDPAWPEISAAGLLLVLLVLLVLVVPVS